MNQTHNNDKVVERILPPDCKADSKSQLQTKSNISRVAPGLPSGVAATGRAVTNPS